MAHTKLNIALWSKGRIGRHSNTQNIAKIDERLLTQQRMKLDLENLRLILCVLQYVEDERPLTVTASQYEVTCRHHRLLRAYLRPIFLTSPSSTSSSIAFHVSCMGTFAGRH